MDEVEKYKQRLEVIAEKRRLQEEEDKVKREKEEERIRQRQLKRKSLREQWLMDPAPLSPTYQNPQSPTRLEGENMELAEAPEKPAEDGQTAGQAEDARNELVLQNGEKETSKPKTPEEDGKLNQTPAEIEAVVVLTNGRGVPDSNGASELTECAENARVEPDQNPNEEEEEGTLMMRAECVLITDETDDVESDKTHLPDPEAGEGEGVAVKTETPSEALEDSEGKEPSVEPLTRPLECVTVTAVPVYTEAPLPALSPANEDAAAADRTEAAPNTSNLSTAPLQFLEVPLTGPEDGQNKGAGPGEKEPLLRQVEASNSEAQPADGNGTAHAETAAQNPEESRTPKQKSCQCCSIM